MFSRRLLLCLSTAVFTSGFALRATDFWLAKPYTEWSDKDIRKIMSDSPWARSVSVTLEMRGRRPMLPGPAGANASDRPGIAEAADYNPKSSYNPASSPNPAALSYPSGPPQPSAPIIPEWRGCSNLIVRWQSSLAVQQALVKVEYREKAGSSPEAKKRLEADSGHYIIAVACLPAGQQPRDDDERSTMLRQTTLTIPGKDHPILATAMVFVAGAGDQAGLGEARFLFPRDFTLTVDDKEAGFATKFGKAAVKAKFDLRRMVLDGRLGL